MSRTLSRLLRYNDIIRIFAICQICILIFTIPVFASAPTQDVDDVIQTTNNFTVWTDYTQNFSIYYGEHEVNYSEALLNSIAQTLKYHGQGTSYHIITNSSSNGASPSYYISGYLEDVTWNQWKINEQLKENKTAINNQIQTSSGNITSTIGLGNNKLDTLIASNNSLVSNLTQISGTLGYQTTGNLFDIKDALEKINYDNKTNGTFVDSSYNTINANTVVYPSDTYYFRFSLDRYTSTSLYKFVVPCTPYGRTRSDNYDIKFYQLYNNTLQPIGVTFLYTFTNSGNAIEIYVNDVYYHLSSIFVQIIPKTNNDQYYVTVANPIVCYGMSSENPDYYPLTQYMFNKLNYDQMNALLDKDFTATISGGDFTLIVPVLDPDVEFNMDVDLSLGDQDDVTDLINDTKDLTDTGTTVQQLLDTLNDVLELFFNQTNKDTVETISTQYHTFN